MFKLRKINSELRSNLTKDISLLEKEQYNKLKKLLHHAYDHSPYYRELFKRSNIDPLEITSLDDISRLPITSRNVFRGVDNVLSEHIDINKCKKHTTSGTTGSHLMMYFTRNDNLFLWASYHRARVENGYRPYKDVVIVATNKHTRTIYSLLNLSLIHISEPTRPY